MGNRDQIWCSTWVLALLAAAVLLGGAPATALAQDEDEPAAEEPKELDLDHVKELRDEGKDHFEQAADVDLSRSKRNDHIRDGYKILTEAFKILDDWCEAHPEDAERLEDLIVEIHQMRYWLRKEAPIGVIEEDDSNVRKGKPPDWPDKPPDDLNEPALPPSSEPGAAAPPRPAPPPPGPDPIEEHLKFAEDYARKHPYDLAGIRDLYLDILEHAQPGTSVYVSALKRVSEMNGRLKEAYRILRNEDPDSLELSGAEERSLVHELSKDLKDSEADVRLRAAEYLGLLGSGDAARQLVPVAMRDRDERVVQMAFKALEQIGGRKVAEELAKVRRKGKEDAQLSALRVLANLVDSSPVEARYASISLGEFTFSKYDGVADQAITQLEELGAAGTLGLMNAITLKDHQRRLRVIRALGETGDGRAADVLGAFLVFGAKGRLRSLADAAKEAIKKIGRPCVPYLARFVEHPRNGQWTRYLLREITGVSFKSAAAVRAWWKRYGD